MIFEKTPSYLLKLSLLLKGVKNGAGYLLLVLGRPDIYIQTLETLQHHK